MKKINLFILIIALMFLTLTSCSEETEIVSLITPSGTPSLALSTFIDNAGESINYDIVSGSDPLVAAFTSGSHDIIVAPVNLGAKMYNANGNYLFYKSFFWGNSYVISKKTLTSIEDLDQKEVVVFGQNSTPDIVFQAVLKNYPSINVTISYVSDVATANSLLASGKVDYALSAEPALSKLKSKLELNVIDLQVEWSKITGKSSYPQAGIFVKKDKVNNSAIIDALQEITKAINVAINSPTVCASSAINIDTSFETLGVDILVKAIPNCHFELINDFNEEKNAVEYYLQKMIDLGFSKQMGGSIPDENFYIS